MSAFCLTRPADNYRTHHQAARQPCGRGVGVAGVVVCALALVAPTLAQPAPTAAQRKLLHHVALGRARAQLFERVRELPLRSGFTIGDWLARDADLKRDVHLWIRRLPRARDARLYADAVCEADVRLTPNQLQEFLAELVRRQIHDLNRPAVTVGDLERAEKRWEPLWATGRANLLEHLGSKQPPGWEPVLHDGVLQAQRMAENDAFAALHAQIGRLRLPGGERLQAFLEADEAVEAEVMQRLRDQAELTISLEPDRLALAEVRIGVQALLRILTDVHASVYAGDALSAADLRGMILNQDAEVLVVQGLAAPPTKTVEQRQIGPVVFDPPPWVKNVQRAAGRYIPADGTELDVDALADAAWLDGLDQLRQQVAQLEVRPGVTVAEYLAYHQNLKRDVLLFMSGAHPTGRPRSLDGGGLEVDVVLPLQRLWEILRRNMRVEEVEQAATTQPKEET